MTDQEQARLAELNALIPATETALHTLKDEQYDLLWKQRGMTDTYLALAQSKYVAVGRGGGMSKDHCYQAAFEQQQSDGN